MRRLIVIASLAIALNSASEPVNALSVNITSMVFGSTSTVSGVLSSTGFGVFEGVFFQTAIYCNCY